MTTPQNMTDAEIEAIRKPAKRYAERDHEALGQYYLNHVEAMTSEGLHSKADIAGELAWRDAEIDRLKGEKPATVKMQGECAAICRCGRQPCVEVDPVSQGCYIECTNPSCMDHLTVAAGSRASALLAWNYAAAALAAQPKARKG